MKTLIILLTILFTVSLQAQDLLLMMDESGTDTIPSFSFTPVADAELSSYHEGYAVLSGLSDSCTVVSSDTMKYGLLGTYDIASFRATNGDTIYTPVSASGSYSTATSNTIVAGGRSRDFIVTTKVDPTIIYYLVDKVGNKAMLFKTGTYAIKLKD